MHGWYGVYNLQRFYPYGGILMMIFGILLLAGIIYFIVQINRSSSTLHDHRSSDDPIEILKRRYAEGSLTEEEFIKMKHDLEL